MRQIPTTNARMIRIVFIGMPKMLSMVQVLRFLGHDKTVALTGLGTSRTRHGAVAVTCLTVVEDAGVAAFGGPC